MKELQNARKVPREDRTDRSLPPSRNLEGFLARRYKAGLEGPTGFGREEGCRRERYVEEQQS